MTVLSKHVVLLKSNISHLGGLEKYTIEIAKAFQEKGCQVTLLTTGPLPENLPSTMNVHTFFYKAPISFLKIHEFEQFVQSKLTQLSADIVFGLDRNLFQTHIRAGNGVHKVCLQQRKNTESFLKGLSFAINPLHQTLLRFEKTAFEHPLLKVLFTNSHMVKEEILQHYSINPSKIAVVHNGVGWSEALPFFHQSFDEKSAIVEKLSVKNSCFTFLFLGHNFQRKGLSVILSCLSQIKEKDFQLLVVGKDKNLKNYIEQTKALGLDQKVFFFNEQKDVASFYQLADCLLLPSLYDPFANVILEALAMGVFVITTKTNGAHEVLSSQNGVVLSSPVRQEEFLSAIEKALDRPKTKQSSIEIRDSIKHLDFPYQLKKIVEKTLES